MQDGDSDCLVMQAQAEQTLWNALARDLEFLEKPEVDASMELTQPASFAQVSCGRSSRSRLWYAKGEIRRLTMRP